MLRYVSVPVCGELKSPGFRRLVSLSLFFLFVLGFSFAPEVKGGVLEDAARQLAQKIAAALPPYVPSVLTVQNLSTLSEGQVSSVRSALQSALRNAGFSLSPDSGSQGQIRVTLSESLAGYLWVAEVRRGESSTWLMISFAKPAGYGRADHSDGLTLRKDLVWTQDTQMMDIKFLDDTNSKRQRMAILEPTRLAVYEQSDNAWKIRNSFSLERNTPWPRDLRGELVGLYQKEWKGDTLAAMLPGFGCQVPLQSASEASKFGCSAIGSASETGGKPGWLLSEGPLLFDNVAEHADAKNFFTGQLAGENGWRAKVPPFYSAAFLGLNGRDPGKFLVSAGLDGHAHLYSDAAKELAAFAGWGSDLTTVLSDCDTNWRVLATGSQDWTHADTITAFGVSEQGVVAVTKPLEFPGPVVGLGPEQLPALGEWKGRRQGAFAIIRNLQTGNYEAYRISLSCGG